MGLEVLTKTSNKDTTGYYIGTSIGNYDNFKHDEGYIYSFGRYGLVNGKLGKVNAKLEYTLYNLTELDKSKNYDLNIRGLDVTIYFEPGYDFFIKPYIKYGAGLSIQEYIDHTTNTTTETSGLSSGFMNFTGGLGLKAEFYNFIEIYSEYEYKYFTLDKEYESQFLEDIYGVKFGVRIKF